MIGRKHSRSLISRLEALESKKPGALIFEVTLDDGSSKRVNFSELMAMKEGSCFEDGVYNTGFPEWRIVEGNDLRNCQKIIFKFEA